MESLTVLYDASCSLCQWATRWLDGRRQILPLYFVPAGSDEAHELFPWLDHSRTLDDITVVSDDGLAYEGERAWVMCLWCLHGYRGLAERMATPALLPSVKRVVATVSRYRPHDDDACPEDRCGN
jgi:predicted DCC family thiol-disulfide oxidoreductase YuxK